MAPKLDPRRWDYSPPPWLGRRLNRRLDRAERRLGPEERVAREQRALELAQRKWGNESRPAVRAMEDLAHRYQDAGNLEEALILHTSALAKRVEAQGPDHPATAHCELCVARMLMQQGRDEEAVPLLAHVVVVGQDPAVAQPRLALEAMRAEGIALRVLERYDEAETLLRQAVACHLEQLGDGHATTFRTQFELARVLAMSGKLDEALPFQQRIVRTVTGLLGPSHPLTVKTTCYLAVWLHWARRDAEARAVATGLYEGNRSRLGEDHSDMRSMRNLIAAIDRSTSEE